MFSRSASCAHIRMTLMRRLKDAVIECVTALLGDRNGLVLLQVMGGPAKGAWLSLNLRKGEAAFALGTHERVVTRRMADICNKGWVVWDCGTHVGYDTVIFARKTGPTGAVVGFEPDPENFRRTAHNLRLNKLTNASVVPFAVGGPAGVVEFVSSGNQTSHIHGTYVGERNNTAQTFHEAPGTVFVECISLNQALLEKAFPRPDLIKLDLEGAEGDALLHMDGLLAEVRPLLVIELHNHECAEALLRFSVAHRYDLTDLRTGRTLDGMPLAPHVLCTPKP